jgi:hypothetical protein
LSARHIQATPRDCNDSTAKTANQSIKPIHTQYFVLFLYNNQKVRCAMNLQQLSHNAQTGLIDELNLISLEGGIYLLEARMDGISNRLADNNGQTLCLRSIEHAREVLKNVATVPFHLVHAVVHEEMCGLPAAPGEVLRVPISMHSSLT